MVIKSKTLIKFKEDPRETQSSAHASKVYHYQKTAQCARMCKHVERMI
jgi:hypothetical protein